MSHPLPWTALLALMLAMSGCMVRTGEADVPVATVAEGATSPSTTHDPTSTPTPGQGGGQVVVHFPENLTVTVLELGDASATLIQTSGAVMLYDAGSAHSFVQLDEGLRSRGVTAIDFLFLSGPNESRTGGCEALLHSFPVARLYRPAGEMSTWPRCEAAAARTGVQLYAPPQMQSGQVLRIDQHASVELLDVDALAGSSLTIRLDYGSFSLILAGDSSCHARSALATASANLVADAVDLATSEVCPEWVDATHPSSAFLGIAAPAPVHLEAELSSRGIDFYRTASDGDIAFVSNGASWQVTTAR